MRLLHVFRAGHSLLVRNTHAWLVRHRAVHRHISGTVIRGIRELSLRSCSVTNTLLGRDALLFALRPRRHRDQAEDAAQADRGAEPKYERAHADNRKHNAGNQADHGHQAEHGRDNAQHFYRLGLANEFTFECIRSPLGRPRFEYGFALSQPSLGKLGLVFGHFAAAGSLEHALVRECLPRSCFDAHFVRNFARFSENTQRSMDAQGVLLRG